MEGTYIVVKTRRAWQDADGSKHWNLLIKDIFLEITPVVRLNKCSITDSACSYLYLQALNQCSWASELAECSCRWQDIHLETRREGCTMQRIEQWMKGHFVSCRGWARGSHHSRSGVIPKLGHFRAGCRKRRVFTNDGCLWMSDTSGLTGGRKRQLIFHLRCLSHIFLSVLKSAISIHFFSDRISQNLICLD